MTQINIRPACTGDIAAVTAIGEASLSEPWTRQAIEYEIEENNLSYTAVCTVNEVHAGYADIWLLPGEAQVITFAVAPPFRRRGIGEAVMRHVLEYAARHGCELATLEVRAGNIPAQRLYRKLGFEQTSVRPGYYSENNEDALLMEKSLVSLPVGCAKEAKEI